MNYNNNNKKKLVLLEKSKDYLFLDGGHKYCISLALNNNISYTSTDSNSTKKININLKELKRSQLSDFKNREMIHVDFDNFERKHYLIDDYSIEEFSLKRKRNNRRVFVNWYDNYMSASKVRNYMLDDPFLDYLKMYGTEKIDYEFTNKQDKFSNYIMKQGQDFEEDLYNKLIENFQALDIKQVCYDVSDIHNMKKHSETIKMMKEGVQIIYQGLLVDKKNKTYGSPDLLIRSDVINILFPTLNYNIETGCKFNNNYHYIVCDIKGTTIHMNSDDITMRNSGSMKAFKGQIYIYQKMLNMIQQTENEISLIWGKKKKNDSKKNYYHISDPSKTVGIIDYCGKDSIIIEKVNESLKWLKDLKENGSTYDLYPQPSHPNLYPNMKNDMNNSYGGIKKKYAKDIKEITCVYNCGIKRRKTAHDNNITSYDDDNISASVLGFKDNSKVGNIVNHILDINKKSSTKLFSPDKIKSDLYNWRNVSSLEIFIDFETMNSLVEGIVDNRIFMIGIGYYYNNKYNEKCFIMEENSIKGEIDMFKKFYKHVENLEKELNCSAKYFHWYDAEPIFYNRFMYRSKDLDFIDLEKIFRNEPITIKNCLSFKLKDVATTMYNHNMISTIWDKESACSDGRMAMILANELYKENNNPKDIYNSDIMKDIIYYNMVDVKVLYEILNYIRTNH